MVGVCGTYGGESKGIQLFLDMLYSYVAAIE